MAYNSAKPITQRGPIEERRITQGRQTILINSECSADISDAFFSPSNWLKRRSVTAGRGAAWFVSNGEQQFVLRHFRRGGALARVLSKHYLFSGEHQTRSFAEFRLLARLWHWGLPVPQPCAAQYVRFAVAYKAALLTWEIPNTQGWSKWLSDREQPNKLWAEVGKTIAVFHAHNVDHADLNAHNILIDSALKIWLIDFDKGQVRVPSAVGWQEKNLRRLYRSINKILPDATDRGWIEQGWEVLQRAYAAQLSEQIYSS